MAAAMSSRNCGHLPRAFGHLAGTISRREARASRGGSGGTRLDGLGFRVGFGNHQLGLAARARNLLADTLRRRAQELIAAVAPELEPIFSHRADTPGGNVGAAAGRRRRAPLVQSKRRGAAHATA